MRPRARERTRTPKVSRICLLEHSRNISYTHAHTHARPNARATVRTRARALSLAQTRAHAHARNTQASAHLPGEEEDLELRLPQRRGSCDRHEQQRGARHDDDKNSRC
jgi:hypothetical protein